MRAAFINQQNLIEICVKNASARLPRRRRGPPAIKAMSPSGARVTPAAERNQDPIKRVLVELFSDALPGRILEIACGTGQHAAFLSSHLQGWINLLPTRNVR
jgi:hypothetical protein